MGDSALWRESVWLMLICWVWLVLGLIRAGRLVGFMALLGAFRIGRQT